MNLFDFFKRNNKTAANAKERLQILVSHQRAEGANPDFIKKMREELLAVIKKYVNEVDEDQIQVQLQKEGNCSILELNVTLPTAETVVTE